MKKILGIIGGMGPKASLLLHTLLLSEFPKYQRVEHDQDFPDIIHFSLSSSVPDRMSYILNSTNENPAEEGVRQFYDFADLGERRQREIIVGIPCNTFHASPIYDVFIKRLKEVFFNTIHPIHLIEETAKELTKKLPPSSRVGILSTTGEWQARIYDDSVTRQGFRVVRSDETLQKSIQECIYNEEWGLKTATTDYSKAVYNVHEILAQYKEKNINAVIWGCTEFSLISEEIVDRDLSFFDSTRILVDRMLTQFIR